MLIIALLVLECGDEGIDNCVLRQRISHCVSCDREYRVTFERFVHRVLEVSSKRIWVISCDSCDLLAY